MNTLKDLLDWLDNNNTFVDSTRKTLTSGITRKIKNNKDILNNFQRILNLATNDPAELIYNVVNPNCSKTCENCGKPTTFDKYYNGYRKACCKECSSAIVARKTAVSKLERYGDSRYNNTEKNKKTKLERYGKEVFVNPEKAKQTKLERYGDANYNNAEKQIQTCLKRYGKKCALQNEDVKKRIMENNLATKGVAWNSQLDSAREKMRAHKVNRFVKDLFSEKRLLYDLTPLFDEAEYKGVRNKDSTAIKYSFKCNKCGSIFEDHLNNGRIPVCRACHPYSENLSSKAEKEIVDFIKEIYSGNIIENDRHSIYPLELDISIPDKKVAIEYNGLYWHSNIYKGSFYHLDKSKACESNQIRLIQIFSDEWEFKKDIIKDIIRSALGIYSKRIFARKCKVFDVVNSEASSFLNKYHIQGSGSAFSVAKGLYFEDELVSLITFKKAGLGKTEDWELHRFVNKEGYNVIGGFSKLLKDFKRTYKGSIVTYSDRRLFSGKVYREAGFREEKPLPPEYYYTKDFHNRENRLAFTKKILTKDHPEWKDLTEEEIMRKLGYVKIYGCGNWKFIME